MFDSDANQSRAEGPMTPKNDTIIHSEAVHHQLNSAEKMSQYSSGMPNSGDKYVRGTTNQSDIGLANMLPRPHHDLTVKKH